ncbi:ATP-dependent dethiobiotin synthetase BioD [Marinilabiliaceae bacterium JC017]|nr:ATP-dependent dethiobiotin synthetase BioD [Marinilabiliaceae bacterium JC017]
MSTYFITAIDTDAGKTIATGLLGKHFLEAGKDVVTMKLAQTGCTEISEDIYMHRQLMGQQLTEADFVGETCPYLFPFPASPHLAAQMDGREISGLALENAVRLQETKHEWVLVEGVGGLMVPLNPHVLVADFIEEQQFPVILITSGKLGSINHTLLTLEVMKSRGIQLYGVVYNHYPVSASEITADSRLVIRHQMDKLFPEALWGEIPLMDNLVQGGKIHLSENWFVF